MVMTTQEIFNTPAIREIEKEILHLLYESEHKWNILDHGDVSMFRLLEIRKTLLDDMFEMDGQHKQLLRDFNDALKLQLLKMRNIAIETTEALATVGAVDQRTLEVRGKCFLGCRYPEAHPVQTIRAKNIWDILCGRQRNFAPLYELGVQPFTVKCECGGIICDSENRLLYIDDTPHNWNNGLDKELTDDMFLCYAFHNLWDHVGIFSIFDLLWVRDFEIKVVSDLSYRSS